MGTNSRECEVARESLFRVLRPEDRDRPTDQRFRELKTLQAEIAAMINGLEAEIRASMIRPD